MGSVFRWMVLFVLYAAPLGANAWAATPVARRVLRPASGQTRELAINAPLDEQQGGRFVGWRGYAAGYRIDRRIARTGPASARCAIRAGEKAGGIAQVIRVEQQKTAPIFVGGWSKADGVSGSPDNNYSIYVDLVYEDGSPLWGQAAPFSTGTHDWQHRQVTIMPTRPVRQLTVYGLFRGHTGDVWFDDFSVRQLRVPQGAGLFDGELVAAPVRPPKDRSPLDGVVLVRDAAAGSDFYSVGSPDSRPRTHRIAELGLDVTAGRTAIDADTGAIDLQVADRTGRDRAVNLYYVAPVQAIGWRWWDNIQQWRAIEPRRQYANVVRSDVGATGMQSHWPFACISSDSRADALLVTEPRVCRLGYDAVQQELYASFDLGLAADTKRPGRASVRLYAARVDPRWPMRSAAQLYYRLLPELFDQRRVPKKQGNWMAFTKISSVRHPEDFYFAVHESNGDVRWDNEHGVLPFVYVEPMTYWMRMPPEDPRTYDGAMVRFQNVLADPKAPGHAQAWATKLSGLKTADGRYQLSLRNTPWCDGAVFANCADPEVPEDGEHLNQAHLNFERLARALQAAEKEGGLAGVYLDSLEGWGFAKNWRREHWRTADLPLTYDTSTRRPVLLNIMSTYEFTRAVADWTHASGKLLMANAVPHRFPWLAGPLDLMGTETNWLRGARFSPPPADSMYLKRTMAWHKPYMFLMNTHYDDFGPELVERYMQRCLFYGMFPGFFSEDASTHPYFGNPAWYNRDRHLFRKYLPVIKRIAEAGWEPITLAQTNDEDVWTERFGRRIDRGLFFTLMNTADEPRRVQLRLDEQLAAAGRLVDLLSGDATPLRQATATLRLQPEEIRAFQVR